MNAKRLVFLLTLCCAAAASLALAPKRGKERLLALTVTPTINFEFHLDYNSATTLADLTNELSTSDRILELRKQLRELPGDSGVLIQLGRLLESSETNEANRCFQQAFTIAEQRIALRPHDGLAQIDLGDACDELEKKQLAEKAYRAATQISSNEWRSWAALGQFLDRETRIALYPASLAAGQTTSRVEVPFPAPEKVELAANARVEAAQCFDRAVSLAPDEVDAHLLRAWHKCAEAQFNLWLQFYQNQVKQTKAALTAAQFSKSAVPDLQKAAALRPRVCQLVGLAAWFEWASTAMTPFARGADRPTRFDEFPESARRTILTAITDLSELGRSSDDKHAAAALEYLGALRILTQENKESAVVELRRAVALDPDRDRAWDMLMGSMVDSVSPADFAEECENRLKHKKSARNHVIFAKALFRREAFEQAAGEAKAAIKLETNNVPAHLMLCAALLRQDKGEEGEEERKSTFLKTHELVEQSLNAPEGRDWWLVFGLDVAIGSAIDGEIEVAKDWLDACQKQFPGDVRIKEILSALP